MKVQYLSLEEILRLHFQVVADYGGAHGVRDESRLISVVEAPKMTAFDTEQYPTIFDKAAVYLRNIIGDHPFTDGNIRTGLTVCAIFLMRNGKRFIAAPGELEDFTVRVATDHLGISVITSWMKQHSV